MTLLGGQREYFKKFRTLDMTSEGLGEMFEGDSADMCAGKFSLTSMGGRVEGLVCANPGARTPIAMSKNLIVNYSFKSLRISYNLATKPHLYHHFSFLSISSSWQKINVFYQNQY